MARPVCISAPLAPRHSGRALGGTNAREGCPYWDMTSEDPIESNWKAALWRRVRVVRKIALGVVLVGLCVTWLSGVMDGRLDQILDSRRDYHEALAMGLDGPPDFVATVASKGIRLRVPPGAGLKVRIEFAYFNLKQRLGIRDPARTMISPSRNGEWSIRWGLDYCTEITGRRYLVAREGVRRLVSFGTTNRVTGVQWAAGFEKALRDNGWLLVPVRQGLVADVVKVVPKDKLEEYRKAGLVKVRN
jgi:hypothetical protein